MHAYAEPHPARRLIAALAVAMAVHAGVAVLELPAPSLPGGEQRLIRMQLVATASHTPAKAGGAQPAAAAHREPEEPTHRAAAPPQPQPAERPEQRPSEATRRSRGTAPMQPHQAEAPAPAAQPELAASIPAPSADPQPLAKPERPAEPPQAPRAETPARTAPDVQAPKPPARTTLESAGEPARHEAVAQPEPELAAPPGAEQPRRQLAAQPAPTVDERALPGGLEAPPPAGARSPAERRTQGSAAPLTAPEFEGPELNNPQPRYPLLARRRGLQGTVLLRVTVSKGGRALKVRIVRSSGADSLDRAAREAVAKWRFVPGRRGEELVQATVDVPVEFRLEGRV